MGVLIDMLPKIEAEARTQDILKYLGCFQRRCTVIGQDDVTLLGRWVRHNDETNFFEDVIERQPWPVFRSNNILEGPVAYIPRAIAEWIIKQHRVADLREEENRQAKIDADGWRQHAAMVSLS